MFASSDADDLLNICHPDLAIPDFPGCGGLLDDIDDLVHRAVVDDQFNLGLWHEINLIFGASVRLGVSALAAETLDLGNRDAIDSRRLEGLLDIVDLEWLHDCCNELHVFILPLLAMVGVQDSLVGGFCVQALVETNEFVLG